LVDAIERRKLLEQGDGRLLTDSGYPGDIIRLVTNDGLEIHHLVRPHAQLFDHVLLGDVVLIVSCQIDRRALVHQLQQITVTGDDLHAQPLGLGPARHRAKHIIRFEALHLQPRDIERVHQLADALDLRPQVFRHFGARGLVLWIDLVAEGLAGVESHCQVVGLLLFQDSQQLPREAVRAGGGFTFRGLPARARRARREGEVHAVRQRVTVDQIEGGGHMREISLQ